MKKIQLPYRHYYYLNILKSLRRETLPQAIEYLYNHVDENSNNWIDVRYAHFDKPPVTIDVSELNFDVNVDSLMKRIQGLPPEIRPVTDGPYSLDVKFEEQGEYTIIDLLGYKICDFSENRNLERISRIFPLVKDKFPFDLTINQYGIYRDAGSQFWRLIQEKDIQTMPNPGEVAMDVGAHIGYRALAMHYCVGKTGKVYAIEVEDDNFKLLQKNIEVNNFKNMFAIHEAIDSTARTTTLYSRDKRSMAHGLRKFEDIQDPSAIDRVDNKTSFTKQVQSITMDDLFKKYKIDKVDNMHISVTGHEVEVLKGINAILPSMKKVRVSCPYHSDGIPNVETAQELLVEKGFANFGRHGSAVIADRKS